MKKSIKFLLDQGLVKKASELEPFKFEVPNDSFYNTMNVKCHKCLGKGCGYCRRTGLIEFTPTKESIKRTFDTEKYKNAIGNGIVGVSNAVAEAGIAILEFCKTNKTNIDDLSAWLSNNYGKPTKPVKEAKTANNANTEKVSKFTSNFREQLRKAKTGN